MRAPADISARSLNGTPLCAGPICVTRILRRRQPAGRKSRYPAHRTPGTCRNLQIDSRDEEGEDDARASSGKVRKERSNMELTFVAKDPDSVPDGSPALYRTDRESWVVQGWAVTDPAALAALNLPDGETCVEIPDRLIPYFQTRT